MKGLHINKLVLLEAEPSVVQRLAPKRAAASGQATPQEQQAQLDDSMARDCMKAKGYRIENAEGKTEEEACLSSNSSTQRATSAASSA